MKDVFYSILFFASVFFTSCHNSKNEDFTLITVDLSKDYPLNDTISIQQLGKVEYIPLETDDHFLCDGYDGIKFINNEIIVFYNISNNDFLIFNSDGKAINKFNRQGQGPEEYLTLYGVIYDSGRRELFINSSDRLLKVYDLHGNFKRQLINFNDFIHNINYKELYSLDEYNFLLFSSERDSTGSVINKFSLFSKQSGEEVNTLNINTMPYHIIQNYFSRGERSVLMDSMSINGRFPKFIVKHIHSFFYNEYRSDTIFEFSNDLNTQNPIIIREPSIYSHNFKGFLFLDIVTQDNYFLRFYKTTFDSMPEWLMVNKKTKQITRQNFYNEDDLNKNKVYFGSETGNLKKIDDKTYYKLFDAFTLKEAYYSNELQGELKELAAKIKEDDNPVLMIISLY
jgi:hypothetical protein